MKWCVILFIPAFLLFAGCEPMAQEEGQTFTERIVEAVDKSVDAQQTATTEIITAIEESGTVSAEKLEEIKSTVDKADEYVDLAQVAAKEAAKVYEEKKSEDKVLATIEALKKANEVTSPANPYSPLIDMGLGIATILAGGYGAMKKKELNTVSAKYKAHKQGVEEIMRSSSPEEADTIYAVIGQKRKENGV